MTMTMSHAQFVTINQSQNFGNAGVPQIQSITKIVSVKIVYVKIVSLGYLIFRQGKLCCQICKKRIVYRLFSIHVFFIRIKSVILTVLNFGVD